MDQLISISKIFSEKIFRIPDYQRGYAWTLKEVEDFWGDLLRLENDKNHYVGVLTLEPVPTIEYNKWLEDLWIIKAKRYTPYYVVDGQQRLTTSILLIYSILEIMIEKKISKLNYTTKDEISSKYIYEHQDENKNRTYMYGYENDNPSYEYLITKIYNEKVITTSSSENETIYTNNLGVVKKFFYEKLIKLTKEELEGVYTKITQHFLFNMYIICEDIDVFVTFETMNNRGKPLSNLELLKNRLIYISTLFKLDDTEKNRLRKNINNCWKKIYHILGKSKERLLLDDEFLVTHFMLYFAKSKEEIEKQRCIIYHDFGEMQSKYLLNKYFVVQRIFDNSLTYKDCFEYIDSLSECINFWGILKNPSSSQYNIEIIEYIDKINFFSINRRQYYRTRYLLDFSYLNVFMLACFRACGKDDNLLLRYLKAFEKYMFALGFYDAEAIDELDITVPSFSDIVIKLSKCELSIEGVITKWEKIYQALIDSNELNAKSIRYYGKNGFYEANWLRYFLCEYELNLMKKSKSQIEKLNRWEIYEKAYNSIEHIYPKNSNYKYWVEMFKEYTTKQKNSLKNSLGNFVVISSEKNSKLGNKSFNEKKSNSQNTLGYKYGTYAEIELTEYNDWNANNILKRGIKLTDFLFERWGIKIGSSKTEDKQKFLGIDFILNNN